MHRTTQLRAPLAGIALISFGAFLAPALSPVPASAPSPPLLAGGPTLINSLPYVITVPGAYCLAGNLGGFSDDGISVEVSNVTIDLGGFTLQGAGLGLSDTAIHGQASHLVIRNGTIRDWGGRGVLAGENTTLSKVLVSGCGVGGTLIGPRSRVEHCQFKENAGRSIEVASSCRVIDCFVDGLPDEDGVSIGSHSVAEDVLVEDSKIAFTGFAFARFERCNAREFHEAGFQMMDKGIRLISVLATTHDDAEFGISVLEGSEVTDRRVEGPLTAGIVTSDECRVVRTTVSGTNGPGILAASGTSVLGCEVRDCSQSASAIPAGILAFGDNLIEDTLVDGVTGPGISFVAGGGRVERCTLINNAENGLVVRGNTEVRRNHIRDNMGIGILATGQRSRIENNEVNNNQQGIVIQGTKCFITGNRASNNPGGNFTIPYDDTHGVVTFAPASSQVTNPLANFQSPN